MIPGYCMSLKATQQELPAGCKNVTHDMERLCDYWKPYLSYPWPTAGKWCRAGKMDLCCHDVMVKHYKDVVVLAEEKNLKFSKDDVYKVDIMAIEMAQK